MIKVIEWHEGFDPETAAPCAVSGMPNEVYHGLPGISNSGLSRMIKSPAHYKYSEGGGGTTLELGSAIHCRMLEPEVFDSQYLLLPDVADRRSSEYKQAVKSLGQGNVLVGKEVTRLEGMVSALKSSIRYSKLCSKAIGREIAFFARDPESGVLCKIKMDMLCFDEDGFFGVDLKSTADAEESAFSKSIANYGYHRQSAFYSDVFEWYTGYPLYRFWFPAIESQRPHGVLCRHICSESSEIGRSEYRPALDLYAECLRDDYWPCYADPEDDDECAISLPDWKMAQYDNEIVDEIT